MTVSEPARGAETVRVAVTFERPGELGEALHSWLISTLSDIGATEIEVRQIDGVE